LMYAVLTVGSATLAMGRASRQTAADQAVGQVAKLLERVADLIGASWMAKLPAVGRWCSRRRSRCVGCARAAAAAIGRPMS
jgi:hypothetical protein